MATRGSRAAVSNGLQPDELEFLAEEYLVDINPKFEEEVLHTLTVRFTSLRSTGGLKENAIAF